MSKEFPIIGPTGKLDQALDLLDKKLEQQSLELEIIICGTYAIQLIGIQRSEYTLDVDTLKKIQSPKVLEAITEVGNVLGLSPHWLNDQASTVSIPKGTIERATPLNRWK